MPTVFLACDTSQGTATPNCSPKLGQRKLHSKHAHVETLGNGRFMSFYDPQWKMVQIVYTHLGGCSTTVQVLSSQHTDQPTNHTPPALQQQKYHCKTYQTHTHQHCCSPVVATYSAPSIYIYIYIILCGSPYSRMSQKRYITNGQGTGEAPQQILSTILTYYSLSDTDRQYLRVKYQF